MPCTAETSTANEKPLILCISNSYLTNYTNFVHRDIHTRTCWSASRAKLKGKKYKRKNEQRKREKRRKILIHLQYRERERQSDIDEIRSTISNTIFISMCSLLVFYLLIYPQYRRARTHTETPNRHYTLLCIYSQNFVNVYVSPGSFFLFPLFRSLISAMSLRLIITYSKWAQRNMYTTMKRPKTQFTHINRFIWKFDYFHSRCCRRQSSTTTSHDEHKKIWIKIELSSAESPIPHRCQVENPEYANIGRGRFIAWCEAIYVWKNEPANWSTLSSVLVCSVFGQNLHIQQKYKHTISMHHPNTFRTLTRVICMFRQ